MGRERAALARSVIIFFTMLAAAGLFIAVLNEPFNALEASAGDIGQTSQAATGRGYIVAFWDALPFIMVFLAFFQLMAAAAAERRLPGQ